MISLLDLAIGATLLVAIVAVVANAVDVIKELRGAEMSKNKWISIEEQEPIYEGWYLVYFPLNEESGDVDYIDLCLWNGINFMGGALGDENVHNDCTHWMPLPEPPKG